MRVSKSVGEGLSKLLTAPSVVFWIYLSMLLVALPLTVLVRNSVKESIGTSTVDESLLEGFDLDWYGEFSFFNDGLADTFSPRIISILGPVGNLNRFLDGEIWRIHPAVAAMGLIYLLVWCFLAGGILDRYVKPDQLVTRGRFFSRGGVYFFRFVRLLVFSLLAYWLLFDWVGEPLQEWVSDLNRDATVERTVIIWTTLAYLVIGLCLVILGMIFDYAKIILVARERHSAIGSLWGGCKFVAGNPIPTLSLYLVLVIFGFGLLLLYSIFAPGPGQSSLTTVFIAFAVGQIYLILRICLKLWFLSSQTSFYMSSTTPSEPETVEAAPAEPVAAT